MAPVALEIVNKLYADLPELIHDLSGEGDSVPGDVLGRIAQFRRSFLIVAGDPVSDVLDPALAAWKLQVPANVHAQWRDSIKDVAAEASKKLEKHMPPYMKLLERRFRYSPRHEPQPLPLDPTLRKEFIGCLDIDYGAKIQTEYESYVEDVRAMRAADAAKPPEVRASASIKSYSYWDSKSSQWPVLSKVAKWHLNFPTSNISAERGCAALRGVEAVWQRNRMKHDTIRRELKFVYNCSLLESMAERELAHMKTL